MLSFPGYISEEHLTCITKTYFLPTMGNPIRRQSGSEDQRQCEEENNINEDTDTNLPSIDKRLLLHTASFQELLSHSSNIYFNATNRRQESTFIGMVFDQDIDEFIVIKRQFHSQISYRTSTSLHAFWIKNGNIMHDLILTSNAGTNAGVLSDENIPLDTICDGSDYLFFGVSFKALKLIVEENNFNSSVNAVNDQSFDGLETRYNLPYSVAGILWRFRFDRNN